jgi:hypothetical protein
LEASATSFALLFEGDDVSLPGGRHLTGQFGVERLIDRGKYSAHNRRAIRSFARISSFSARSNAITFCDRDLRVIGSGSFDTVTRGGGT